MSVNDKTVIFHLRPSPSSSQQGPTPSVRLNYGGFNKNLNTLSLSSNLEMWCLLAAAAFSPVGNRETIDFHNPNIQLHYIDQEIFSKMKYLSPGVLLCIDGQIVIMTI